MYESFPENLETFSVLYGGNVLHATSSAYNKYQKEYCSAGYILKPTINKR